jgi:uncharacterized iron-regulated protein
MKQAMTEPSLRLLPLTGLLAVALLFAVGSGAAMSLVKGNKPPAHFRPDKGHFHEGLSGRDVPTSVVMERLAGADVVFLGEIHDRRDHRNLQLVVLEALAERAPGLALGLEFFSREDQSLLDDLAAGRRSNVAFRSRIRIAGGYPYGELIALARERGIRLLGLNLPRWVVSQVARRGWESLSARERERWPRPREASKDYQRFVRKAFVEFEAHNRSDFQLFLTAQNLWDSTMAESIHRYLEEDGSGPMVVVVGMVHVAHGLGIPARLEDGGGDLSTVIVLHHDALSDELEDFDGPVADYIWYPDRPTVAAAVLDPSGLGQRERSP